MADEIKMLKLKDIFAPEHMRKHGPEKVASVAESMKRIGQLQNIVVTPMAGDIPFELLAGACRDAAAILNGWEEIRCLVKYNLTDEEKALITIWENEDREDLLPVDRGLSYIRAMEAGGLSYETLGKKINKTGSYVGQYVVAAKLSEPVREASKRFEAGIGIINQIVRLDGDESKIAMLERCQKEGLSVKQLTILVNKALNPQAGGDAAGHGKAKHTGLRVVESAKGITLPGILPKGSTKEDAIKAVEEAFKQKEAEQQAKPDPAAVKAARDALKADKDEAGGLEAEIKLGQAAVKNAEKGKLDSAGMKQQLQEKIDKFKDLKLKIKEAEKGLKPASAKPKRPVVKQCPDQPSKPEVSPKPQALPLDNNAASGFDLIELKLSFEPSKPPAEKLAEISLALNESKQIYATAQIMGNLIPLDKNNKDIKWQGEGVEVTPDWGPEVTIKLPAPLAQPGKLTVSCRMPNGKVIEASAVVRQG